MAEETVVGVTENALVAEPGVSGMKKRRAPRRSKVTPEANVALEPSVSEVGSTERKSRRGKQQKPATSTKNKKGQPKVQTVTDVVKPVKIGSTAPVSVANEMAELLQLEEENAQLRRTLAEKLRAENADLRRKLGLS